MIWIILWICEAKVETMIRLFWFSLKIRSIEVLTVLSERVVPGRSAPVESESNKRISLLEAISPIRAKSVLLPSIGEWSILKSPV